MDSPELLNMIGNSINIYKDSINIHNIGKEDFDKIKKMYPKNYGESKDVEWIEIGKITFFLK